MNYVFEAEFVELSQGQSALHGQATLARTQLSNPRVLRFKHQTNFWKPSWFLPNVPRLQRRLGGRIALVTETIVDQTIWLVYNLHLESQNCNDLRLQQLCEVLDDTHKFGPEIPILVAGDFNLDITRGVAAERLAEARFRNPFAMSPMQSGRLRGSGAIDWMLIRGSTGFESSRVHTLTRGSDHYPLSLVLRLC
jgi:endonuclease/exonuclease/phosphatase family metal-dependent hydrolase